MSRRRYQEWRDDVDARQRNIVFPDTAANEARFWRNLYENKGHLTAAQRVGVGIIAVLVVALFVLMPVSWGHEIYGSWMQRIESAGIDWILGVVFLGAFLLLVKWGTRGARKR